MASTPRMRKALDKVEARRVSLERAIIAELEARFFAEPEPEIEDQVIHLGPAAINPWEGSCTAGVSQFSITWFA